MKKLLGLTFILTSLVAVAATPQGNTDKTADMSITARVIEPLTVKAQPMAFGKIIQNTEATANSTFTVKGETGENVIVTIDPTTELTSTTNPNKKMTVNIVTTGGLDTTGAATALADGDNVITVKGTLPASQTINNGEFTGTLTATVRYQ